MSGSAARHREPFLPFVGEPACRLAHKDLAFETKRAHPHHQDEDPRPTPSSPAVAEVDVGVVAEVDAAVVDAVGGFVAVLAPGQAASRTRL